MAYSGVMNPEAMNLAITLLFGLDIGMTITCDDGAAQVEIGAISDHDERQVVLAEWARSRPLACLA